MILIRLDSDRAPKCHFSMVWESIVTRNLPPVDRKPSAGVIFGENRFALINQSTWEPVARQSTPHQWVRAIFVCGPRNCLFLSPKCVSMHVLNQSTTSNRPFSATNWVFSAYRSIFLVYSARRIHFCYRLLICCSFSALFLLILHGRNSAAIVYLVNKKGAVNEKQSVRRWKKRILLAE